MSQIGAPSDPRLGVARSLGWQIHMRCANGYRLETRFNAEVRLPESAQGSF
jgi:hypothetical protein